MHRRVQSSGSSVLYCERKPRIQRATPQKKLPDVSRFFRYFVCTSFFLIFDPASRGSGRQSQRSRPTREYNNTTPKATTKRTFLGSSKQLLIARHGIYHTTITLAGMTPSLSSHDGVVFARLRQRARRMLVGNHRAAGVIFGRLRDGPKYATLKSLASAFSASGLVLKDEETECISKRFSDNR